MPQLYTSPASIRLKTIVKHRAFRYFFDAIIVLNAVFILFDLDGFEFGFLAIFIVEILLKIYSFGFVMFGRKLWNLFDVIVIGSAFFISIIEELREDSFDSSQVWVNKEFCNSVAKFIVPD